MFTRDQTKTLKIKIKMKRKMRTMKRKNSNFNCKNELYNDTLSFGSFCSFGFLILFVPYIKFYPNTYCAGLKLINFIYKKILKKIKNELYNNSNLIKCLFTHAININIPFFSIRKLIFFIIGQKNNNILIELKH